MVLESENWKLENGKKTWVLAFQKVAKTGNTGETKSSGKRYYERYLSMQKVNRTHLIVLTISVITVNVNS